MNFFLQDDVKDDDTDEVSIHCVTCGADIHTSSAIRHMERCYNKVRNFHQITFTKFYLNAEKLILKLTSYSRKKSLLHHLCRGSLPFSTSTGIPMKFKR
jgi:hypothetical protein